MYCLIYWLSYVLLEKKELIQLGKAEGLTNEQISKQLGKGFGLRTVERYSK